MNLVSSSAYITKKHSVCKILTILHRNNYIGMRLSDKTGYIPPQTEMLRCETERCMAQSGTPLTLPDLVTKDPVTW